MADVEAAIAAVGLNAEQRVADLEGDDQAAFRRFVGWDAGGPVVERPTPEELAARTAREAWKAPRLGRDRERSRLLLGAAEIDRARSALAAGTAPAWLERLLVAARDVSCLSIERLLALIPERVPWNAAGSFCPACFGDKSDIAIHAPFWRWRVDAPESIACPHCDIRFPHADYPEEGRLGLSYAFYLTPAQRRRDWHDGVGASSFGGGPTHVSLSGEAERCGLNWLLGQLEPMALAAHLTGDTRVGDTVRAVLLRLAQVYPGYPLYTYRQEYYDCEPAYAVEHCDEVPTAFRRSTSHMFPAELHSRLVSLDAGLPLKLAKRYWAEVATTCEEAWNGVPATRTETDVNTGESVEVKIKYRIKDLVGVASLAKIGKDIVTSQLDSGEADRLEQLTQKMVEVDWEKRADNPWMRSQAGFAGQKEMYLMLHGLVFSDQRPGGQDGDVGMAPVDGAVTNAAVAAS